MAEFSAQQIQELQDLLCRSAEDNVRGAARGLGIFRTLLIVLGAAFVVAVIAVLAMLFMGADGAAILGTAVAAVASGGAAGFVQVEKGKFVDDHAAALAKLQELREKNLCPPTP